MIWFDSIHDLQYYNQPKGVPCYCEALAYPFDMYLQGHIHKGSGDYTLKVYVYSADGLTMYEDATAYFDYYFGKVPATGNDFFNARLKSFSPAMCAHECYILKVQVTQPGGIYKFNKFTERYCQNNCCDVAHNIRFEQVGFSPNVVNNDNNDPAAFMVEDSIVSGGSPNPNLYVPSGDCGEQLVRLITRFDCIDNFTGDFYGLPDTVYSGSASFTYRKVSTIKGRIVRRPREITRDISYNCRLLHSESAAQYLLEGFEFLPTWKMYELEGQLHANTIMVDDFRATAYYSFAGGTPMKQVNKCFELFKLEATLEDCTQRQIFGCSADCNTSNNFDSSNMMFAIPATYDDGGFFNSNGEKVANDYDGLIDYFRTRDGATNVNEPDTGDMNCTAYKVFSVTSAGQVDSFIYHDAPVRGNRVYGQRVGDINELCAGLPVVCMKPLTGEISVSVPQCTTATAGVFTVEDIDTDEATIVGYGNWAEVTAGTFAAVYNNEVSFSLEVVNGELTEDPANTEDDVYVTDTIAVISANARPLTQVILNSSNSTLPEGAGLTIDTNGLITYYGPVTSADPDDVTIELSNIKYNL